ncbi:arachidonate 15-lipoxygenase B [Thalassophryne amazonica]|uniref:arachidonate 15-lipoxygenase B n=1 Tax=Thalassophryne amazonica TaxID=390379 RepID=UPI001471ED26|nr:arachidonate 15-lipoxygenase B [Thalassophryne amazonica]
MDSSQVFEVTVHTSPGPTCGTYSRLWLSLIGSQAETPPTSVTEANQYLLPGSACQVRVRARSALGRLVLIRLRLEAQAGFPDLNWHCRWVEVCRLTDGQVEEDRPRGKGVWPVDPEVEVFLCDRWLQSTDGDVELRSGKLCLLQDETEDKLKQHRVSQLQRQQKLIRWSKFVEGAPQCVDVQSLAELGPNLTFTHKSPGINLHYLKGFSSQADTWTSFTQLETFFAHNGKQNDTAGFVRAHWLDDWFFGYQCLNGCNPLLRQTRLLPPHLSVTSNMLRPFLPENTCLEEELEKGNVYLLDYEVLDGVPANVTNGKQTHLPAPLCLFHQNQQGELLPIAIQLQQTPGPQNPVFLPSDPGCDWLLAKILVRCADFQCHQLGSHYLRTHMLGELCCVATLRQLPEPHPLHQLLMPHVKTSLQINFQARTSLLAAGGVFDKEVGCGLTALPMMLSRAAARIRYRSLCVPDDLVDCGVDKLSQCYYAEDALRVWDVLHRFVDSWVNLCYHGDMDVEHDSELQNWMTEINTHGFPHGSGFPQCLLTKADLVKFVTMIIFSCSALHAAINFSQLDFALWMPDCPAFMWGPPPQTKGSLTEDDILSFLPDVKSTCRILMTLSLLSQPSTDYVPLCHYREAVFRNSTHHRLVEKVQAELEALSDDITESNRHRVLSYPYLCPAHIENSVAI